MIRVAFTGWAGSGKTKAAEYLKARYGGEVLSFASEIKRIDRRLFDDGVKVRSRLQKIGESMRSIEPLVWVNVIKRDIELISEFGEEKNIFVDDLRRLNEYEMLIDKGFVVIRTVADEDIRIQRLIERDGQCDVSLMYNSSENGCADLDLLEVENNRSLEELYEKLDGLVSRLHKHN